MITAWKYLGSGAHPLQLRLNLPGQTRVCLVLVHEALLLLLQPAAVVALGWEIGTRNFEVRTSTKYNGGAVGA